MDFSLMILVDSCIGIIIALLFCFFGYKFARPLFPLPALFILDVLVYVFIFGMYKMNALGTWLFFGGISVMLYVFLFFIQRIAGFFTGLLGSGLMLIYVINAFGLQNVQYLYPVCLTICAAAGIFTIVYEKTGVVIFTSVFGACTASFIGMHIYLKGVSSDILTSGNILTYLGSFLTSHALLITGISIAASVVGILIQVFATSQSKALPGNSARGMKRSDSMPYDNEFLNNPDLPEDNTDQTF